MIQQSNNRPRRDPSRGGTQNSGRSAQRGALHNSARPIQRSGTQQGRRGVGSVPERSDVRHHSTRNAPSAKPRAHTPSQRNTQGRSRRRPQRQGERRYSGAFSSDNNTSKKPRVAIPPLSPDSIRIVPLGGVEEIGRNMTAIEFGNDIIIVDCGIQFHGEDTPGIDYILPNTKYLEERKDRVRAMLITHGHLDHIGGIPYIAPRIGNPPVYTRNLTMLMIKKRQEEFPHLPALDMRIVEKDETITIGAFTIKFFAVTHTIPDSMGIIIQTPFGSIVHTGDLKLDHMDGVPSKKELEEFKKFEKENVLLLMADSTNVERPGFSIPEQTVFKNLEDIIQNTNRRLIIGTFASQIERIAKIIEIAEKCNKKVVIDGRSMKINIEIAKLAGVLKHEKDTVVTVESMGDYPPERIVALVTGAQGDEFAVLMRMANKSHKHFKINKNDVVVLSSSVIPGNERAVQKLKDNLSRQGARIVHYQVSDVHSSGHANRDETKWIHEKVKPRFFIPIHGYHYMLRVHADIAREAGIPEENIIIPDNSMLIEIQEKGKKIVALKETAPQGLVLVDGFSVGDIQEVVIRDRQMLAQDGMFVIVVTLDITTGHIRKSPDLISRGFVYLRESQELLKDARNLIKKTTEDNVRGMHPINFDYLKNTLTDTVSQFLFKKTNKRPIVIPVVLGI